MNKKFLSAILFGALALASTGSFVSCKDYDDDIKNLQSQINGLASAKDLSDQVAALEAKITAVILSFSARMKAATRKPSASVSVQFVSTVSGISLFEMLRQS